MVHLSADMHVAQFSVPYVINFAVLILLIHVVSVTYLSGVRTKVLYSTSGWIQVSLIGAWQIHGWLLH